MAVGFNRNLLFSSRTNSFRRRSIPITGVLTITSVTKWEEEEEEEEVGIRCVRLWNFTDTR